MTITETEKEELFRAFYLLEEAVALETTASALQNQEAQSHIKSKLEEEAKTYRNFLEEIFRNLFKDNADNVYSEIYSEENLREDFRRADLFKKTAETYVKLYANTAKIETEEAIKNLDLKNDNKK